MRKVNDINGEISRRGFLGAAAGAVVVAGGLSQLSGAEDATPSPDSTVHPKPVTGATTGDDVHHFSGSFTGTVHCAIGSKPPLNWGSDAGLLSCDTFNSYGGDGHVVSGQATLSGLPDNDYQDFTATATGHFARHLRDVWIPANTSVQQDFSLGHISGT